jgi:hypothetical protein
MQSPNMKSITRRIERLEARVSPAPEMEFWQRFRKGRKSGAPASRPVKVRFGNLRRLPKDYKGERHWKIVKHLPDRNGQEWVEFEEVPGPAPSAPPEPGVANYLNIGLVGPYGSPDE